MKRFLWGLRPIDQVYFKEMIQIVYLIKVIQIGLIKNKAYKIRKVYLIVLNSSKKIFQIKLRIQEMG